jgi:hypothetical protein
VALVLFREGIEERRIAAGVHAQHYELMPSAHIVPSQRPKDQLSLRIPPRPRFRTASHPK